MVRTPDGARKSRRAPRLGTVIEEYDAGWPARFEEAAAGLREASSGTWTVEHIGSTSVVGLAAKPVIDIAVRVARLDEVEQRLPALEALGWRDVAAGPKTHRVLVRLRGHERTHIAHFFEAARWETCNQRIFRDWLRSHPEDRARYEQAKRHGRRGHRGPRLHRPQDRRGAGDHRPRPRGPRSAVGAGLGEVATFHLAVGPGADRLGAAPASAIASSRRPSP